MLNIQIKSIRNWPGKETSNPKRSQFKSTYRTTISQLEDEIKRMPGADPSSLAIEMWVDPRDIRLDGQLRANARPQKQGIILSFNRHFRLSRPGHPPESKVQTLSYPCDAFNDWQDNLRAITLSLAALRQVERYGVFKYDDIVNRLALPSAEDSVSTRQSAAEFLERHSGIPAKEILFSDAARSSAFRKAAMTTHPDRGGNPETFQKIADANRLLSGANG